jgi:pyruvate/2-oxoglutarate dehydrogenase complex dihydrolipoamide acyltransferase (E2) component
VTPASVVELPAPVQGSVIAVEVQVGQHVAAGTVLLLLESMKMEVPLEAPCHGRVLSLAVAVGEAVIAGETLLRLQPLAQPPERADGAALAAAAVAAGARQDLQRLQARRALLADAARPEAMARRHASGLRSARENLADLLDADSFTEYGALAVAAQRSRLVPVGQTAHANANNGGNPMANPNGGHVAAPGAAAPQPAAAATATIPVAAEPARAGRPAAQHPGRRPDLRHRAGAGPAGGRAGL